LSQRAVIGPIANEDLLKDIDRRIVTLFEVAEVVPKCDCGHAGRMVIRPLIVDLSYFV
jgi:hypothetical protein